MTLYELTEEAINQFDYYKHPNIDEWEIKIDEVLSALHEPTIRGDKLESLYFTDDTLEIRTSYSVRCCECSNDMSVPISILQDSDPVKKANQFYWSKELEKAQRNVSSAKADLERAYKKLEETQQTFEGVMQ